MSAGGAGASASWSSGARAALPLLPAVLLFGVSFGILARAAGLSALAATTMSATAFTGAAQFAAVSVLDAGGALGAAIVAAAVLNLRYVPMGVALAPALTGTRARRLLEAQATTDESWALSRLPDGTHSRARLLGAASVVFAGWVGGTGAGSLGGDVLGAPEALGLDAMFPALFLALLVGQLGGRRAVTAALLGALIAAATLPLLPAGLPVCLAAAAALVGWRR